MSPSPLRAAQPLHARGTPPERLAILALLGPTLTGLYYLAPVRLQQHSVVLFAPQAVVYLCLVLWARSNGQPFDRLGLRPDRLHEGLHWGIPTGVLLGVLNVSVILWIIPWLGGDIQFLRDTPHAKMPTTVMFPWTIVVIAVFVELNFRGFLLGRLLALWQGYGFGRYDILGRVLTVVISAVVFSFDPFMLSTFKHLHWIAMWDGLVWGTLWMRRHNLYSPIVAHAVEVSVLYIALKQALAS